MNNRNLFQEWNEKERDTSVVQVCWQHERVTKVKRALNLTIAAIKTRFRVFVNVCSSYSTAKYWSIVAWKMTCQRSIRNSSAQLLHWVAASCKQKHLLNASWASWMKMWTHLASWHTRRRHQHQFPTYHRRLLLVLSPVALIYFGVCEFGNCSWHYD